METYEADIDINDSMVSASSYLQPPLPQQPQQLWATLTKQEEELGELAQEDEDDEIDELAVNDGKPVSVHTLPVRMLTILSHHLRTLEGMAMGPPPKKLFGSALDDIHT
jgi:hypothetical protein